MCFCFWFRIVAMLQCTVASVAVQTEQGGNGRPASGRDRCVGTPWHPYAGRGPTSRVASASSPSLCARRSGKGSCCHCHELCHHRARSPPHHRLPNRVPGFATIPSTSSSHPCAYSASGEATFLDPPWPPCAGPHRSPSPPWSK
jgi:hypothetical protein